MAIEPLLLDLPEELLGPRVLLRPYRPGDGQLMFEAVNESLATLMPWLPWAVKHETPEDSELVCRRLTSKWHSREDLTLGIFERETGAYLGGTGVHRMNWDIPSGEIGYWIRASAEGKGYVTEATRVVTDFGFGIIGFRRMFIRGSSQNVRSAAVPPRVGYVFEGTLRNSLVVATGELHDTFMYSMTDEEWRAHSKRS